MPGCLNLSSQPASEVLHCDWTCNWGHRHHSLQSKAVWAFWSLIWPLEILWQVLIDLDNHLWERKREQWTISGQALLQNFRRPGPDLPNNLTNSSAARKSWPFNLEREQRMRSTRLFLCILPWVVQGGQNSSKSERLVTCDFYHCCIMESGRTCHPSIFWLLQLEIFWILPWPSDKAHLIKFNTLLK